MASFDNLISNDSIQKILTHPDENRDEWVTDLSSFLKSNIKVTRNSIGESSIKAIQRLLIFLSYSTSSTGAFVVDGDFGRGTNRAVAQFDFEFGKNSKVKRKTLCYPCVWNTAHRLITKIPEITLTKLTLKKMAELAIDLINSKKIITGNFENALYHLNALHERQFLDCRKILARYGEYVHRACERIHNEENIIIRPEWVLAIIRQETSGIIRPRFEQHKLTELNNKSPKENLMELRMRSMSMGIGQIMGFNYEIVGAANAYELYTAPESKQVEYVAKYLSSKKLVLNKSNPKESNFRTVAKFYNGKGYEAHRYHEKLERWYKEFVSLLE